MLFTDVVLRLKKATLFVDHRHWREQAVNPANEKGTGEQNTNTRTRTHTYVHAHTHTGCCDINSYSLLSWQCSFYNMTKFVILTSTHILLKGSYYKYVFYHYWHFTQSTKIVNLCISSWTGFLRVTAQVQIFFTRKSLQGLIFKWGDMTAWELVASLAISDFTR